MFRMKELKYLNYKIMYTCIATDPISAITSRWMEEYSTPSGHVEKWNV